MRACIHAKPTNVRFNRDSRFKLIQNSIIILLYHFNIPIIAADSVNPEQILDQPLKRDAEDSVIEKQVIE